MSEPKEQLKPDPRYRPSPQRAIYLQGQVNQALLDRLTPRILQLQAAAREPITVYIDSPGGSTFYAQQLLLQLRAFTQDYGPPCHLISVATGLAASAAADILSSGDYVIAYPHAVVLYHGVRREETEQLTMERASSLAESLKIKNNEYAIELTKRAEMRFLMRYFVYLKPKFEEFRTGTGPTNADDPTCFLGLLKGRLSESGRRLIDQAKSRSDQYRDLFDSVEKKLRKLTRGKATPRQVEASVLKALVDYEISSSPKDAPFSLHYGGLARINEDFSLLTEGLTNSHGEHFKGVCQRWGDFILNPEEKGQVEKLDPTTASARKLELARPYLLKPWLLFVALCHSLQAGEHVLTAKDAFWLGLIDEVFGDSSLPCIRTMIEYQSQP